MLKVALIDTLLFCFLKTVLGDIAVVSFETLFANMNNLICALFDSVETRQ